MRLTREVGANVWQKAGGHRKSFSLFQIPKNTSLYGFACAFWDYSLNDWSTYGCFKGNSSSGLLTCHCNHTTNFAALWVNITSVVQSALILTHSGLNVTHDCITMVCLLKSWSCFCSSPSERTISTWPWTGSPPLDCPFPFWAW